jgi:hypothetical protein
MVGNVHPTGILLESTNNELQIQDQSFFLIKLAAFQDSGGTDPPAEHLIFKSR